jgi:pantoate--beta-alanine ligase
MRVAHTIAELSDMRDELTATQPRPTVSFVPTMGALHAGHCALIGIARNVADVVVVSIFVNPLQFGPDEDYARYPRTLEHDLAVCEAQGVDIVFVPSVSELYPSGRHVSVTAGPIGTVLEGRARPSHFDGMLTVVSKLFNIVRPDKAIFGQKDAQQLAAIRRLVADLNFDIDIVAGPIVREEDGLALSSRNHYLLPPQRKTALVISAALRAAARHDDAPSALRAARTVLGLAERDETFQLDYLCLVNPLSFAELPGDHQGEGLLVIAAQVGDARLVDNVELVFGHSVTDPEATLDLDRDDVGVC